VSRRQVESTPIFTLAYALSTTFSLLFLIER
jgi:hypothetical protein